MQEIWMILRTTASDQTTLGLALLDITLVAVPLYIILALLRQARSMAVLWGIVVFLFFNLVMYLLSRTLQLQATAMIYERFWIVVVLLFLVIFQNELRKGLMFLGQTRLLRAFFPQEQQLLSEIIRAVEIMADRHIGVLLAFERHSSLSGYLATGTEIDAVVSSELLRAIFNPESPIHDGAVVVQSGRLLSAGCILPLTEDPRLSKDLGTRHRAAIGLSEETDALVVVVSEETGTISVCQHGSIERYLEPDHLRTMLEKELRLAIAKEEAKGD